MVTEAVGWGYPVEFVLDMPVTGLGALFESVERVKSKHIVESTWLNLAASQGSGKDVKKALKARTERAGRPEEKPTGLKALARQQRGIRAPKRK